MHSTPDLITNRPPSPTTEEENAAEPANSLHDHRPFNLDDPRQSPRDQRTYNPRMPLHTLNTVWAQYRQIASWTNRGKVAGNSGLNLRALICRVTC
jgi:hypothetical protein